jgi:hypothetical protein
MLTLHLEGHQLSSLQAPHQGKKLYFCLPFIFNTLAHSHLKSIISLYFDHVLHTIYITIGTP